MELLHEAADPAPILNHAAAEERLLARYDRPARALLLEPWETELLARLVQAWRAHQSPPVKTPPVKTPPPRTTSGCCARLQKLRGCVEEGTGPDRFARRAGLEPRDAAAPI